MRTIKEIRNDTGLSQSKFGEKFHIPTINISNWEQGVHKPPSYVVYMIEHILELEKQTSKP
jgi:putative transcriptional regulator